MSEYKGKLRLATDADEDFCGAAILDEKGYLFADGNVFGFSNVTSVEEIIARARRLVACWNVCEGIPTDALENTTPRAFAPQLRDAFEIDELIEALRPFANYACDPPCECHNCKARAILAKHAPKVTA